ncbi:putative quinol monooxygenase [Microbacterium aureliae]
MTSEVVLTAEFTALPGHADDVARLIADYGDVVRDEPGNVHFEVYRRVEAPEAFFVFEIYRDRAAFEAHLAGEAGAVFNAKLQPRIVEDESVLHFLLPVR